MRYDAHNASVRFCKNSFVNLNNKIVKSKEKLTGFNKKPFFDITPENQTDG